MKFYIRTDSNANEIAEISGRIIEIAPFGRFLVDHRRHLHNPTAHYIGYCITEPETGYLVEVQGTLRDAVACAKQRLANAGAEKLAFVKKRIIKQYGVLNQI